ncbi:hypothetical protein HO173_010899 [Letharia columbiana]|uniref:Uncharacterized protein n=1 Tax=Letharia columbiana TaxID=112416 RepID=A0A8H6FLM2_9LECA|nr:uncharacterized protein HO173_010899 [Letharia columbiana]KAF6230783.1 hypothetical protein HO173_010899 [Letharia columbiana]
MFSGLALVAVIAAIVVGGLLIGFLSWLLYLWLTRGSRERLRQERDRFRQDRLNYLNGVPSHMGLPSNTGYAPPVNQLLELNLSDSDVGSVWVSTAPAPEAASQVDSRPPWSVNSGGFNQTTSAPCGHPSNVSPQSLSNQFASMPPSFPPRTSDRSNAMAASGLSPRQEQIWT